MMRRVISPFTFVALQARWCSDVTKHVDEASFQKPPEAPYFAKGPLAGKEERKPANEPAGTADNLHAPEFNTAFGKFETRPPGTHTGPVGAMHYEKFKREVPNASTMDDRAVRGLNPIHDHHPYFDYSAVSGDRQGGNTNMDVAAWKNKTSMHALYRSCLRGLALCKQFYMLNIPLETMKRRVREKFDQNKHVRDPDAIRHLLHLGWVDFTETITFRKTKNGVSAHFHDHENRFDMIKEYTRQEGQLLSERKVWNGEEQKKEGPFDGYWSITGKWNAEEFEKLRGRVPMSWTSSKGYFEVWKADGTNVWEKNMDYEGWFVKNVDPDNSAARREMQAWTEAGYSQPKHYASKNRRGYRRMVKDVEELMTKTPHEMYAESRETLFQSWIRDWCPESNRVHAEKRLAFNDDDVFTTKFEELDAAIKQCLREFPNPRLWKTDAFYLRFRYLTAHLEYNWAKAPIGVALEKAYNEWVSTDAAFAVVSSPQFDDIKVDKARNPMARSWADFYADFDPDVPETRRLPWYHAEFDYDRRYSWDERCMRMKKWVQTGDVDFRHTFFDAKIHEWEQMVNRPELVKKPEAVEYRYAAPRFVQLYRSLNKRMDMALANQIREFMVAQKTLGAKVGTDSHGDEKAVEAVKKALAATDFSAFRFQPPAVIFPDDVEQPELLADGTERPVQLAQ